MADDTTLGAAVGVGDKISTDDLGAGTKVQRVKVQFGADGSATDASSANPVPVVQTGALPAGANAIGKLAANSGVDIGDVDVTSSALPTGAATSAKQPALGTAGAASADVITIQGIASGTVVPVSGTVTASGPLTDTQLRATPVPVSGTVTANLAAGTNNIGDVDVLTLPALPAGSNEIGGVNVTKLAGTAVDVNSGTKSAGTQRVVIATDQPQLTNAWKVDGSAVTQPVSGTVTASNATGSVAHDGADSGNPVKTGGRARTTDITAVASDDRTDAIFDSLGKQTVLPYAIPARLIDGYTSTALANTTAADVIAAQGAGTRVYVTSVTITNAHATAGTKVELRSATTVRQRVFAAANGGGATITFPAPFRCGDNEAFTARNITTGADVDVSASGYLATN